MILPNRFSFLARIMSQPHNHYLLTFFLLNSVNPNKLINPPNKTAFLLELLPVFGKAFYFNFTSFLVSVILFESLI